MTEPLTFDKTVIFTDIHLGLRNNSRQHNQDCLDFIDQMCEWALANDHETAIFMGDWNHHRNHINISTLKYNHLAFKKLSESFKQVFFIIGNHDLFYRNKRDVHSVPFAELYPNIKLIDQITTIGDCSFVPWLVGDEWKQVREIRSRYIFGHFELPGFKLNPIVEVPDSGEINSTHFKYAEWVFSGHLHKRQIKDNIIYIGNCFPHDFGDCGDNDRGFATLEHGGKVDFVNWKGCPKFVKCNLSDMALDPSKYLVPNSYVKAIADVDLSYEEVNHMKETFVETYNIREFRLVQPSESIEGDETLVDSEASQSIDEIFTKQIEELESEAFDKALLMSIYKEL